jgi:dTDP-4-amino-4,6-dideoxygalactose transaminase
MLIAGLHTSPARQIGVGTFSATARMKELVLKVLDSGRLTAGPMMEQLEREIARLHHCRFALMCNSGTSALQIALGALKEKHRWNDGDEVLVPAVTFVATVNVVLYNRLKPVFVDVEPNHYLMDPALIEARITARTRAIIPVHLAGQPCDMQPIMAIAGRHHLRVVEDSCETMFARYKRQPVGSFGDIGCFSTYVAHILNTGVGGLCTTSDPELMTVMKSLMNHGRDPIYIRMDDDRDPNGDVVEIADRRFSFVRLGHSFRSTELEAALGVAQLEMREAHLARRRAVAVTLTRRLDRYKHSLQLPTIRRETEHVFMFYPLVIVDPSISRSDLIRHLEERGIETRYLLPIINQPVYRNIFGDLDHEYPVAAHLNRNAFYIGCHVDMTDDDVDYIAEAFRQFFMHGAATPATGR